MNKNKNTIHNQKHLTLTERIYIEQELVQGSTFSSIASIIDKDPSTISKEVKRARIIEDARYTGKCHACKTMVTVFGKASAAIGVNGVVVTAIRKILHMSVPILFPGTAVSWASHHMCAMPVTSINGALFQKPYMSPIKPRPPMKKNGPIPEKVSI